MEQLSRFVYQYGLATLWFAISLGFAILAGGQLGLMLAPQGSEEWKHSEWAPVAMFFCVVVGAPFALSGIALVRGWRWRKFWKFGPAVLVVALVIFVARQL